MATARGPLHLLAHRRRARAPGRLRQRRQPRARTRRRGASRSSAIRSALGSGSHRLVRQMLVESLVLAGFGGLMGLGVAAIMVSVLQGAGPRRTPAAGRGRIRSCRARICGARDDRHGRCIRRCAGAAFRSYPSRQCASPAIPLCHGYTWAGTACAAAWRPRSSRLR